MPSEALLVPDGLLWIGTALYALKFFAIRGGRIIVLWTWKLVDVPISLPVALFSEHRNSQCSVEIPA